MPDFITPKISLPKAKTGQVRLADLLSRPSVNTYEKASLVFLGFPSDQGVIKNGGRAGASLGPSALRQALYGMSPHPELFEKFVALISNSVDLGDLVLSGDLATDQNTLAETIAPFLERKQRVVILGGGHETTYGHFLGYVKAGIKSSIINFDAHPDVRPLIEEQPHSGSPFRQAIEHPSGLLNKYTVVGLQPQQCSHEHLKYLRANKAEYIWRTAFPLEDFAQFFLNSDVRQLVSIDLDVIDQSFAPGVSAPTVNGLCSRDLCQLAYEAGSSNLASSLDVVELNPHYDRDNCTAKLSATIVWWYIAAMANQIG
ncbi:MAG: formimidoylglutamase [Bdellovibrionales bacterium]|nr:formimidoylglutamase [Bdellovibrionales bacterium]